MESSQNDNSERNANELSTAESNSVPEAAFLEKTSEDINHVNAQKEWDAIEDSKVGVSSEKPQKQEKAPEKVKLISYRQAESALFQRDFTPQQSQIQRKTSFCCTCQRKLPKNLESERDEALCLAKIGFQDEDPVGFQILTALYANFTGVPGGILRFGLHWDDIGFQGENPATDLRGNFPLALVSLSMTGNALNALRTGKLNAVIRKEKSVMAALNKFHSALMFRFYLIWKNGKTMADSGFVMDDIRKAAYAPKKILKEWDAHLKLPVDSFVETQELLDFA